MIVICRRLAVVAALLAVSVAACGGDPGDSGGGQGNAQQASGRDGAGKQAGGESGGESGGGDELSWPEEPVAHAQPVLRAVVSEAGSDQVHVIDVATGDTVHTLRVDGQAQIEPAGDPTHLVLTQSAEDVTHILDAGIRWVDHGGHLDPAHVKPEVAGSAPTKNPVHVVRYEDQLTVFADDEGAVYVYEQGEDGLDPEPARILRTERPHHGFGIALPDGQVLTGLPSEQQRNPLPEGVRVYDENDERVEDFPGCPALHGEYGHADTFVFGCADGAMVLERHGDHWHADRIPNPDDGSGAKGGAESGAGSGSESGSESGAEKGSTRLGAFYGGGDDQVIGTFGNDAMALVDLERQRMRLIELPASRVDAIWDPYWEQVVVLTSDGRLHAIDPETGKLSNSTRVMDEMEISSDMSRPRPSISTGENWIYLTDPNQNRLIEVGITSEGFEPRRAKDLDFVPYAIGVLGMAL